MVAKRYVFGPTVGSLNKCDCFSLTCTMRMKPNCPWLGSVRHSETSGDAHLCLVQTLAICLQKMGGGSGLKESNFLLVFLNILCANLTVEENDL